MMSVSAASAEVYEVVLVQSAPGMLADVVALYKKWLTAY